MRIVVTGGAGFIGSAVVDRLLADGHQVRVFDNLQTGVREQVSLKAEFIQGDIRDPEAVAHAVAGCEGIVHLAAMVSVALSFDDPSSCYAINVEGTRHVLTAASKAGCRRVVLASSAAVYGNEPTLPKREGMPPAPASPYAYSKWQNEVDAGYYNRYLGLEAVCLRFFNVFGPRQRPDSPYSGVISIATSKLLAGEPFTVFGDGEQTRDFIFVDDVAATIVGALMHTSAPNDVINVGTGESISLLALLRQMGEVLGREPTLHFAAVRGGDVRHSVADTSRMQTLIANRAVTPISEGLARLVEEIAP